MALTIVKIFCKDTTVKDCYITYTTNIIRFSKQWKNKCTSNNPHILYKFINSHGGYKNWLITPLETIDDHDYDIMMIIRHYVLKEDATINLINLL